MYLPRKCQFTGTDGAIPLLANNDFSHTLVGTFFIVDFVAVDKDDHIGILLNGTGFTQVRIDRALVGAVLKITTELGQGTLPGS